ncbi:hypothetical protein V6N13_040375 [Hibiscus sabdariffa]
MSTGRDISMSTGSLLGGKMLSISLWIFLFVFCRLFSFSLGFGVVSISNVGIRCDPGFTVWLFWFDRSEALISGGRVGHGFKALCTQLSAVVFSAAPANALSGVFSSLSWLGLASLFGFSPESAYGGAWLPGLASGRPTPTSSILGTVFRLSSKLLESSCARIGPLSIRAGPTIRDLFGRPIGSSVLGDPFLVSLFGPDLECFFALGFPIQYPGLEQSSLRLGHLLWIQNDRPALLHLRQAELGLSQSGQWLPHSISWSGAVLFLPGPPSLGPSPLMPSRSGPVPLWTTVAIWAPLDSGYIYYLHPPLLTSPKFTTVNSQFFISLVFYLPFMDSELLAAMDNL